MIRLRLLTSVCVVGVVATACVLPARSTYAYTGKAVATTTMTLSASQSGLLVAQMATRGRLTAAYASAALADAEGDASGAQAAFDSIQPPDSRSDAVRDDLDAILTDAVGTLSSMRIVARRGDLDRLQPLIGRARKDIARLEAFRKRHQ